MLAMLDLIRAVCWAISISFSLRECNEWLHLQLPMQHARANDAYALSFVHVPPEGAGKGKGKGTIRLPIATALLEVTCLRVMPAWLDRRG
jgi:hypothetical protein